MSATLLVPDTTVAPPARVRWSTALVQLFAIFVVTRLVIWAGAYAGAFMDLRLHYQLTAPFEKHREFTRSPEFFEIATSEEFLGNLRPITKWDGSHYHDIIDNGYAYRPPAPGEHPQQNIAFFPLYPMATWPVAQAIGNTPLAMLLVANAATLVTVLLLYGWLRRRLGHAIGLMAAAIVMCFPSACYLAFAYAECLMLLGIVGMMILIDQRRWIPAALVCGIATASRPTAVILVPVLGLAYWFASDRPLRQRVLNLIPLLMLGGLGIALYALYLTIRFGSPFVYSRNFRDGWVHDAQRADWFQYLTFARVWDQFKYFGNAIQYFPAGLVNLTEPRAWNMPLIFFVLIVSIGGLSRVTRRWRPLLLVGPFIFLQAYFASGGANFGIIPIGRYMAMAAPALVILAAWMVREWPRGWQIALFAWMGLVQYFWAFNFGIDEWPG